MPLLFNRVHGKGGHMRRNRAAIIVIAFLILASRSALGADLTFMKSEYAARRAKLMDQIPDGAAVILGAQPVTGFNPFVQNNDLMYFSGVEIPNAVLVVDGRNRTGTLFFTMSESAARNEGISQELVKNPREATGIENVLPIEQLSSHLSRLASRGSVLYTSFKPEELARECSNEKFGTLFQSMMTNVWDGRLTRELQFVQNLKTRFPQVEVKDCSPMIWDLRSLKSPAEIEVLRRAGALGAQAATELMKACRVGVFEYELSAIFEYFCRKAGADIAYNVIISSAENHPYLHYYKHDRKLADGDFLVVDAGPDVDYYDVDISLSFPANGRFSPRQREIYQAALTVQKEFLARYRPGLTAAEVQAQVRESLLRKGFDLDRDIFKIRTMQNGTSHDVGLAVHDVVGPSGRGPFRVGQVFACDIYAVFPGEDLGVRIEDTVVITETGCEVLTKGIPREIPEIETLMKQPGLIQILKEKSLY
uniref:Xaa-Pro aminopeptidase n=1 Tax=uncultured Aminicenantes bacterium TaxID=174294 RepID=Q2YZY1_9BACT|nr:probable X-pro aminopeptidase [uncultured Aminicenantes bacterium]